MSSLFRLFGLCVAEESRESELTDNEITAVKESWLKARHADIGKRILYALIDKKPKFADYYGIEVTLSEEELLNNGNFNLQATRIQHFLDTVVSSIGFCPDEAVHAMAHRIGQIHYYKGVNFGADNWLVFKKVTVDQIIANQRRKCSRQLSAVSTVDFNLNSLDGLSNSRICMSTIGWNKLMSIVIREMKKGFLDEAKRNCVEEDRSQV